MGSIPTAPTKCSRDETGRRKRSEGLVLDKGARTYLRKPLAIAGSNPADYIKQPYVLLRIKMKNCFKIIFVLQCFITNFFIIAGVIRHWN